MLLREKDKQTLIRIFGEANIPMEVWAYGSRVNGSAHEGSDLDLIVRSPDLGPLPFDEFCELFEQIKESNIPILVEFRDWAHLPDSFKANILRHYEVLFDNRLQFVG